MTCPWTETHTHTHSHAHAHAHAHTHIKSSIPAFSLQNLNLQKLFPIYKKGDTSSIENYRPISLLSSFSKVIEKNIFNQLFIFFQSNNLFYNSQYGFRKKHLTEFAALELIDIIKKELDAKHDPFAVFLDMSKAFDTIDHTILLKNYLITAFNINH